MIRRILAGLMAALLVLFMSVPSFASPATVSDIDPHPEPKTWSEAVAEVAAERAASSSEADIMTLDLDDEDYGISLLSSVGTVTNTVDRTAIEVRLWYGSSGRYKVTYMTSDGTLVHATTPEPITRVEFVLPSMALPPSGTYAFSFDYSSDFSFTLYRSYFSNYEAVDNAAVESLWSSDLGMQQSSGDLYLANYITSLNNKVSLRLSLYISDTNLYNFGGSARFRFVKSAETPMYSGLNSSSTDIESDYQVGVTSSLGSIGDTLEEIVETISLQLEALWNQMYNYIHLPEYEKLEQIRQAIENIRLDVDIDNQDVVNKIDEQITNDNANTNQITNGYDKTGMTDSNTQLDDTFKEHDAKEQEIWEQIEEPLEEFEFSNPITQYLSTFLLFGNFLQDLFDSSGAFADVINLSFVITIALMVVGLYRFKGGN